MHTLKPLRRITTSLLTASFIFSTAIPLVASPVLNDSPTGITFERSTDGQVRMLKGNTGALTIQRTGQSLAVDVANQYAPAFGIRAPASQLTVKHDELREGNRRNIRYQQNHNGIPVIGAELVANVNAQQQMISMSGETTRITVSDVTPAIAAKQAIKQAISSVSKWYSVSESELDTTAASLKIYEPSLIGPANGTQLLVWQLNVTPKGLVTFNEYVLVDAQTGQIALHFNTLHSALDRETYVTTSINILPGTLLCDEVDLDCNGNVDASFAHTYAEDSYDYFFSNHARDSFDDAGGTIISSVGIPESDFGGANAAWTGTQMIYSPGMPAADDVVAHELTHAVTNSTSNLFYYYQSGAINESLSDLWGEFVDLGNGAGNDGAAQRWRMGEDTPGNAIRNMSNPPEFNHPDRMLSPLYHFASSDNGGVHINSGINNKAVVLMVDGGSFNGQTVSGIGIPKVSTLYYDVQTNYLTSGSDYLDLYNALNQSCQTLVGTNGITANDCTQVNNALLAVEMNQEPQADFSPDAEICPAGTTMTNLFYDDFEAGISNWTATNLTGSTVWVHDTGYATSGSRMLFTTGLASIMDSVFTQNSAVTIPSSGTYYLHFNHAYDFEAAGTNYYDGGVIEYSTNNGASWQDTAALMDAGRNYNGVLSTSFGNPLGGRSAFSGISHGYNSTRLNLSSLANQNVRFRFRNTADNSGSSLFWVIDDVRIFACGSLPMANAGPDQNVNASLLNVSLDGSGSSDLDGPLTYQWTQLSGPSVSLNNATIENPSFTPPAAGGTLIFQLTVMDTDNNTAQDTVSINVNGLPVANAGPDQTIDVSNNVNLTGSGSSDPEGNAITYAWIQNSGTPVVLSNVAEANPSFTAPATAESLSFSLTVTDDVGQMDSDVVTITVQDPGGVTPPADGGSSGCTLSEQGRFDPLWILLLSLLTLLHLALRYHQQPGKPNINKS